MSLFVVAHLRLWLATHRPAGLGLVLLETFTVGLLIVRRRPRLTTRSPLAWAVAGAGSFSILLVRPARGSALPLATTQTVQLLGFALALASLVTLGRSFGIVAANRGIRTIGPYRLVRHPLYASYAVAEVGYVLENPTLRNALMVAVATFFQLLRVQQEEHVLAADPDYARYARSVRFRLVPGIF
jgi:protein-S-isoprenylcysteine O-methyltransferase Ste14